MTTSQIVKDGITRLCNDFDLLVIQLGFRRVRSGARKWRREVNGRVDTIYFFRGGSSYGTPTSNSVSIQVQFLSKLVGNDEDELIFDSYQSRDDNGYCYHTRFNAKSWSTYDRCLADLMRVTKEHGIPWFEELKT